MRIYMQTPPMDGKPPRFYHLHLQEDLLEGWTLVTESGYQGSGGRVVRKHFHDRDEALEALMKLRDQQMRKGYKTVFAEGMPVE